MAFRKFAIGAILAQVAQALLKYKGADWSSVAVLERNGTVFKDAQGNVKPLERILWDNGVNIVRQRVWVGKGDYDLDYNLALAKRAQAAGLDVHVNLHFSDSWADPGQQKIPAGWPTDLEGLTAKIYNYTYEVGMAFYHAGINPAIIDIGNEIADGLLWPVGRGSQNWTNTAMLLEAAGRGIWDSDVSTQINVHLNGAADVGVQNFFWENILEAVPTFPASIDMFSASFYPFYGPEWNFTKLANTLTRLTKLLPNKEFMVSEMAWPFSCNQGGNFDFPPDMRPSIPFNAEGQRKWVTEVAKIVRGIKGGIGVEYWEVAWVNNAGLGQTGCEDNIMFEYSGKARDSLSVFGEI